MCVHTVSTYLVCACIMCGVDMHACSVWHMCVFMWVMCACDELCVHMMHACLLVMWVIYVHVVHAYHGNVLHCVVW